MNSSLSLYRAVPPFPCRTIGCARGGGWRACVWVQEAFSINNCVEENFCWARKRNFRCWRKNSLKQWCARLHTTRNSDARNDIKGKTHQHNVTAQLIFSMTEKASRPSTRPVFSKKETKRSPENSRFFQHSWGSHIYTQSNAILVPKKYLKRYENSVPEKFRKNIKFLLLLLDFPALWGWSDRRILNYLFYCVR